MDSVPGPPLLPLLEHIHHVAAILMQSQEKASKGPHAVQEKVAQLLEEFSFQERHGNGVKAGKNFRMSGNHRMILWFLMPSAIRHIGNIVVEDQRISMLLLDGRIRSEER